MGPRDRWMGYVLVQAGPEGVGAVAVWMFEGFQLVFEEVVGVGVRKQLDLGLGQKVPLCLQAEVGCLDVNVLMELCQYNVG